MTRRLLRGCVLLALAATTSCGPRDVQTTDALVGDWRGHVAWHDATTPLVLHVRAEGDSLQATLDAPALGVSAQALGGVSFDSPRVRFELPDSAGATGFDGWLRRGLIVGAFSGGTVGPESNRALQPQLSLKRVVPPAHKSPWPEGVVGGEPPIEPAKERSLAEWFAARRR